VIKDLDPVDRIVLDIASVGTVAATLTNLLPAVAAILTIVWTAIRIFETETIQRIFYGDNNDKNNPTI
jgi:hypothetical protein